MSNGTEVATRFAVTITLKSGVQLRGECDKFTATRNGLGDLLGFKWENMTPQWLHVDLDEVAAVECAEVPA